MEYMKACNQSSAYYKQFSDFDPTEVFTKKFFALIIDNQEYQQAELENSIPQSVSYRKIYNFIDDLNKYRTILNEEYQLKRR